MVQQILVAVVRVYDIPEECSHVEVPVGIFPTYDGCVEAAKKHKAKDFNTSDMAELLGLDRHGNLPPSVVEEYHVYFLSDNEVYHKVECYVS